MIRQSQFRNYFKAAGAIPLGFILLGASSGIAFVLADRVALGLSIYILSGLTKWLAIPICIFLGMIVTGVCAAILDIGAKWAFSELPPGKFYLFILVSAWATVSIGSIDFYCSSPFGYLHMQAYLSCRLYMAFVAMNIIVVIAAAVTTHKNRRSN
jgi:hypothetical protein